MITWDIFDQHGTWLGSAMGFTEAEAIANAKAQGMTYACKAEPNEE